MSKIKSFKIYTTEGFNLQEVDTILDSLDFRLRLGQNKGKDQTRKLYKYFESMKIHLEGEKINE
tara:strand:+ start:136 stop:327 length:192 start_codon:yes stop_codon:yes gene_type:complete